jgi:hypothetical protein
MTNNIRLSVSNESKMEVSMYGAKGPRKYRMPTSTVAESFDNLNVFLVTPIVTTGRT